VRDLTGHKITDRKRGATRHATKKWIPNTQKVDRRPARGWLHRLVRHSVLCRGALWAKAVTFNNENYPKKKWSWGRAPRVRRGQPHTIQRLQAR
jgi:hypothetical protein